MDTISWPAWKLLCICHSRLPGPCRAELSDLQAECRNVEDKNQILLELEQGVGSDECNRLVVGLMRKALVDQAKANQARQMGRLAGVLDGL